jgi:hypothetical protein
MLISVQCSGGPPICAADTAPTLLKKRTKTEFIFLFTLFVVHYFLYKIILILPLTLSFSTNQLNWLKNDMFGKSAPHGHKVQGKVVFWFKQTSGCKVGRSNCWSNEESMEWGGVRGSSLLEPESVIYQIQLADSKHVRLIPCVFQLVSISQPVLCYC